MTPSGAQVLAHAVPGVGLAGPCWRQAKGTNRWSAGSLGSERTADVSVRVEGEPDLGEIRGGREVAIADLCEAAQPVGERVGMDVQDPGSLVGATPAFHPRAYGGHEPGGVRLVVGQDRPQNPVGQRLQDVQVLGKPPRRCVLVAVGQVRQARIHRAGDRPPCCPTRDVQRLTGVERTTGAGDLGRGRSVGQGLRGRQFRGHQQEGLSLLTIVQLFGLLLLFAAFFSAVLLCITSFARGFKEAQAYLIPLMMVSLAPGVMGMLPGLKLADWAVAPLLNIVLLGRDLFQNQAALGPSLLVIVTTLAM